MPGFEKCTYDDSIALIKAMVDGAFSGIIWLDSFGYILEINDQAALMLNINTKNAIGERITHVFRSIDEQIIKDILQNGLSVSSYLIQRKESSFLTNIEPVNVGDQIAGAIMMIQKISLPDVTGTIRRTGRELSANHYFSGFCYTSEAFRRTVKSALLASYTDAPVLILGEDGTENALFAECIHNASRRKNKGYASIECDALGSKDIVQLLFSKEGASQSGKSTANAIEGGTLYINHIDLLPSELQYRIALLIMGKQTNTEDFSIAQADIRIIAGSNRPLEELVAKGLFREDLFYALSASILTIPPLRERYADIEDMVTLFVKQYSIQYSKPIKLTKGAYDCLKTYSWPGNVRQLDYVCQRIVLTTARHSVNEAAVRKILQEIAPLHSQSFDSSTDAFSMGKEKKAAEIVEALQRNGGNKTKTAEDLGISKATLWRHMQKYGITTDYKKN